MKVKFIKGKHIQGLSPSSQSSAIGLGLLILLPLALADLCDRLRLKQLIELYFSIFTDAHLAIAAPKRLPCIRLHGYILEETRGVVGMAAPPESE